MNNFHKVSVVIFVFLILILFGGVLYVGQKDWASLSILFVIFPVALILLVIGWSFSILGNASKEMQIPNNNVFFKNRTSFLIFSLIFLMFLVVVFKFLRIL